MVGSPARAILPKYAFAIQLHVVLPLIVNGNDGDSGALVHNRVKVLLKESLEHLECKFG